MKPVRFLWVSTAAWLWIVLCGRADVRESADYAILSESCGEATAAASSADYGVSAVMEAVAGASTAASSRSHLRHGFAGHLYDVRAVDVAATPATVDEGGTRQAQATAVLDDATFFTLAEGESVWTVGGWPLAGVTNGLVAAGTVFSTTSGVVRVHYEGLQGCLYLLVLNLSSDDFGSYAGDLIDDGWQVDWFGLGNAAAAADADGDADHQDNHHEWAAGTDPLDSNSFLRFWIENVPGQPSHRNLCLSPVVPGRTYTLWSRSSLAEGEWVVQPCSFSDLGERGVMTDRWADAPHRFYQLRVTYP